MKPTKTQRLLRVYLQLSKKTISYLLRAHFLAAEKGIGQHPCWAGGFSADEGICSQPCAACEPFYGESIWARGTLRREKKDA